jgi:hypothetical protein
MFPKEQAGRKRPWIFVGAVLGFVALAAACGSTSKSSSSATTKAPSAPTTAAPTSPPTTPAPTTTTTPFDKKYGTFAPTSQTGSSDGVVPLPAGAKAGLVTATYTGSSNFSIEALDAQNEEVDLLVNTIGNYSGTTAFGLSSLGSAPVNLKVTGSGAWTVKTAPISTAPVLASGATGKGDAVYQWTGKATTWTITNAGGTGNFVVSTYGSGLISQDLLVNEIGPYHGIVPVKGGPAVTTIESDGTWSITYS